MTKFFRKLVCLGDSLTEGFGDKDCLGWVGRLASRLQLYTKPQETWAVVNAGRGGDTVVDGKNRLPELLGNAFPSHMIMAFGANDMSAMLWPDDTGPKINLLYAKKIWIDCLTQIRATPTKLVVLGVLPVNEDLMPYAYIPMDSTDRGIQFLNTRLRAYNDMLRDVCAMMKVQFIDLFADWEQRDLKTLLLDGLHPSREGYVLLAEQIETALASSRFFA